MPDIEHKAYFNVQLITICVVVQCKCAVVALSFSLLPCFVQL